MHRTYPPETDSADRPDESKFRSRGRIYLVIRLLGDRCGGAERLFCEMASMLAEEGYDVTCLHCDSNYKSPFYPLSPKVSVVNLWGKSARRSFWYKAVDAVASTYKKNRALAPFDWLSKNAYFTRRLHAAATGGRPDVIISFLPPANTPTLIAGWLAGAKVIPTNHNVPEKDYRSPVRWDQNPVDRFLRYWSLNAAERVHVLFPTFTQWFPKRIQKKIVVITNYVSPDFQGVEQNGHRRKEIVAVGRLAPVKNYLTLVEAWGLLHEKHPDWTVKIYGGGPEARDLDARIQELGLGGVVKLMGHESDIKTAYLGAELFCHPALHEGFGLSVAEALACGLPVVAFSDCAGVNEFVRDGDNGIMVDRDGGHEALASALDRLITDDELRETMRRRVPDSVSDFSQDAFRRRWTTVIDELIADARKQ